MVVLGVVLVIVGLVLIYWNISYSPYKSKFDKDMRARVEEVNSVEQWCTREEIEKLPEPLQRYCDYIGLEGFRKYQVARIYFKDTDFVFDSNSGDILKMDYDLWHFYDDWFRSAFCQSSMYGVPFEGMDYCTENLEGGMKGMLGKMFEIFDVHTKQGYQAGIITLFAEGLTLNPAVLFSEYVTYETVDNNTVNVVINYNGVIGKGVIYINDEGAITSFYSDERQVENIDGVDTPIGWRCEYEDYREQNGILQAKIVRSVKVFPDKEVVYFSSDNYTIEYIK